MDIKRIIAILIKTILTLLVLSAFLAYLLPIKSHTFANIVLSPFEKKLQKEIKFEKSHIWLPGQIFLEGVSIVDRRGHLYYFKTFDLRYNIFDLLFKKKLSFILRDIKLYQDIKLFESVADMLVISEMPDVEFKSIEGILRLYKGSIVIENISAYNDKMHITANGWIDNDGELNCTVSFSFSKGVTEIIPDVVKTALLKYEGEGWMGVDFRVRGNYKKPSIHLAGETLRLNIMEGIFK